MYINDLKVQKVLVFHAQGLNKESKFLFVPPETAAVAHQTHQSPFTKTVILLRHTSVKHNQNIRLRASLIGWSSLSYYGN